MIHIIKPGALTTVQDLGRVGLAHLGVSPAGAADSISFRIANLLVGNDFNTAAFELTLLGPTLEFEVEATIAISGSSTSAALPMNEAFSVPAGTRIAFGSLMDRARAYLAVRGGLEVPEVLNSRSTFLPAKIGGYEGRPLKAGDRIAIGREAPRPCRRLPIEMGRGLRLDGPIRVTRSTQSDWFDGEMMNRFLQQTFTVSNESNRSGVRLVGQPIVPSNRSELLTEGVALGAVQVPPDGQPIILFVDQQTTGGYPKITNVIAADIPRLGQLRPRDTVTFQCVEIAYAIELLRQQERELAQAFAQ